MNHDRVNQIAAYATVAGFVLAPALIALTIPDNHRLLYSLSTLFALAVIIMMALPTLKPIWKRVMDGLNAFLTTEWLLRIPFWWMLALALMVGYLGLKQVSRAKTTVSRILPPTSDTTLSSGAVGSLERVRGASATLPAPDFGRVWVEQWKAIPELKDTISTVFPFTAWNIQGYSDGQITSVLLYNRAVELIRYKSAVFSLTIRSLKFDQVKGLVMMITSVPDGMSIEKEPALEYWFLKRIGPEELNGTVLSRHAVYTNVRLTKWIDPYKYPTDAMQADSTN